MEYQWEHFIKDDGPSKDIDSWQPDFGPVVVGRTKKKASKVRFRLLLDNPKNQVFIVGRFNSWGNSSLEGFRLMPDAQSLFASIELGCISHGEPYKFLLMQDNEKRFVQDPAAHYFDDDGNSIFWDFEDPACYKKKHKLVDTIHRSTRVLQTDLPGLIVHWADKDKKLGHQIEQGSYYRFIARSGVLEHIRSLGFNTIQFLPFAQSIDGDNWKYRYLVPFQYAIQKNWGSPDDFSRMIDKCHELGIAVIGDFVIGHLPFKDFRVFGRNCDDSGIHFWKNRHGSRLYMKEETPWGTMRVDTDNPYVRQFFVQSALHYLKHYRIDGFRIDNVDGIIRYGHNGEGDERPNGRTFLREFNKAIYEYNPFALIHFESHYFFADNAKMLVVPFDADKRALGATAYNSSRMTYYFHTQYMPKSAEEITPWKFRDIASEKEWGQSNSTIADFHNHDAAAGLMEMRCTGSYAYDAMTCKEPTNHWHAVGKIKVMEAIISFVAEGRTLDLLQTFLLQTGTFEHDSSIKWFMTFVQSSRSMVDYKKAVNCIMDDPAFWPMFTKNRKFLNVDDNNKILCIERSADNDGKRSKYVIVMNLSGWFHYKYKVGLTDKSDYEVVLNADMFEYCGTGTTWFPEVLKNRPSKSFELLDSEIEFDKLAPYHVLVLKAINPQDKS